MLTKAYNYDRANINDSVRYTTTYMGEGYLAIYILSVIIILEQKLQTIPRPVLFN